MTEYIRISNLGTLRSISRVFPLKHKLNFLIKKYLGLNAKLAIRYEKDWHICTTVTDMNQSTIEDVILGGTFSQPEMSLINKLKNELPGNLTFIDVGGNIGTFMCQFRDKSEKIFVFEPIPRLNKVISDSIAYNKETKVVLIPKAVGDAPGSVKMPDSNNSSIASAEAANTLDIEVTTLDKELADLKKIDFIKIDVEGYEMHVLNGAKNLVQKHRPVMLIEVHPAYLENYGRHASEVISFLQQNNYTISYYSFLEELRMPRIKRIFSRWGGNKGIKFSGKEDFLKDIIKEPRLSSYHFYCEPGK